MNVIFKLFIVLLLFSCTQKEATKNEGVLDSSGFTTNVLSENQLSIRWRVKDNTELEAALIGDPGGQGWIAVGFGTSMMAGAKIVVAQNGSDSGFISDATGYNFGLNNNSTTILDSSSISISGTTITASFNVTLSDVNITINEATPMIWAFRRVDQNKQDNLGSIGKHNSRGSTSITFK